MQCTHASAGALLDRTLCAGTHPELSEAELEAQVRAHLSQWWGAAEVDAWKHLRTYRIPFAQPNQASHARTPSNTHTRTPTCVEATSALGHACAQAPPTNFTRPVALGGSLFVCGDHRESATLDGALRSGRRAALAVLAQ